MAVTTSPTYALEGEATMDRSDVLTGLSWKWGFFTNKNQRQHTHLVLVQARTQRNSKIQCLPVEKRQNQYQQGSLRVRQYTLLTTPQW